MSDQECVEEDHLSERSHLSDTEQEISESDDDDITLSTLSHRNCSPQLEKHLRFGSTSSFYLAMIKALDAVKNGMAFRTTSKQFRMPAMSHKKLAKGKNTMSP